MTALPGVHRPDPSAFSGGIVNQSRLASATNQFLQQTVHTVGSGFEGIGIILASKDLGGQGLRNIGESISDFAADQFPSRPDLQGDWWWDTLPGAFGSAAGFLLTASLGRAVGAGVGFVAGGPGGAAIGGTVGQFAALAPIAIGSGVSEQYSRLKPFIASGEISEEYALDRALLGVGPGMLEMLPIARLLKLAGGKTTAIAIYKAINKTGQRTLRGSLGVISREASVQALEEMTQEVVGGFAQNWIEMDVNGQRKLTDGLLEAGGTGGVVGFLLGVGAAAVGLKARGRIRSDMTAAEVGKIVSIQIALDDGVITKGEVAYVDKNISLLYELAEHRYNNREAKIVTIKDIDGKVTQHVRYKEDNVTWQERQRVEHNEDIIGAIQEGRRSKNMTLKEVFQRGKDMKFALPISRDAGFLRRAAALTDDLKIRDHIRQTQRNFIAQLRAIQNLKGLSADQRGLLALELDAEHAMKISRLLKRDDNTGEGLKNQIVTEVKETAVVDGTQTALAEILLEAANDVIKGKPLGTQREIIEGMIETVTDPVHLEVLRSLHQKMLTNFRRRPWSERVGMGNTQLKSLRHAMMSKPGFVEDMIKRKKEMRLNLVKIAANLPPEYRGTLLKTIAKVETAVEFGQAVQTIHKAMVRYHTAVATNSIVKSAKHLKKNPKSKLGMDLLKKRLGSGASVNYNMPRRIHYVNDAGVIVKTKFDRDDRPLGMKEKEKIRLASSPEEYSKISEGHKRFSERLELLVQLDGLTEHDAKVLRYLFVEANTQLLDKLRKVEVKISDVSSVVSHGSINIKNVSRVGDLELTPGAKAQEASRAHAPNIPFSDPLSDPINNRISVFLHEFAHMGYNLHLSEREVDEYRHEWRRLISTPSTKGYPSLAHEYLGATDLIAFEPYRNETGPATIHSLTYFASNPQEFFAQMFQAYVLGTKIPNMAVKSLWGKMMDTLYVAITKLIASNPFGEMELGTAMIHAMDSVYTGEGAAIGLDPLRIQYTEHLEVRMGLRKWGYARLADEMDAFDNLNSRLPWTLPTLGGGPPWLSSVRQTYYEDEHGGGGKFHTITIDRLMEPVIHPRITHHERNKTYIAFDGDTFAQLSDSHTWLQNRWYDMLNQGSLIVEELRMLRYFHVDMNPALLARIEDITVTQVKGFPAASFYTRPDPNDPSKTVGIINVDPNTQKIVGQRPGMAFIHEMGHIGYFLHLNQSERNRAKVEWARLRSLPSVRGWKSKAHDIIEASWLRGPIEIKKHADEKALMAKHPKQVEARQIRGNEDLSIDYWASNPQEFFAQTLAAYVLEHTMPTGVLENIWAGSVNALYLALRRMTINRPLNTSGVGAPIIMAIHDIYIGDSMPQGASPSQMNVEMLESLQMRREAGIPIQQTAGHPTIILGMNPQQAKMKRLRALEAKRAAEREEEKRPRSPNLKKAGATPKQKTQKERRAIIARAEAQEQRERSSEEARAAREAKAEEKAALEQALDDLNTASLMEQHRKIPVRTGGPVSLLIEGKLREPVPGDVHNLHLLSADDQTLRGLLIMSQVESGETNFPAQVLDDGEALVAMRRVQETENVEFRKLKEKAAAEAKRLAMGGDRSASLLMPHFVRWNPAAGKVEVHKVVKLITVQERLAIEEAKTDEAYRQDGGLHEWIDEKWSLLVASKRLSKLDQVMLRYFFGNRTGSPKFGYGVFESLDEIAIDMNVTQPTFKRRSGMEPPPFSGRTRISSGSAILYPPQSRQVLQLGEVQTSIDYHKRIGAPFLGFIHEYAHAAYFNYLTPFQRSQARLAHEILLSRPSLIGHESQAHELIAESQNALYGHYPTERQLAYWASNPVEFFAEMLLHYVVQQRTSHEALTELNMDVIQNMYLGMLRAEETQVLEKLSATYDENLKEATSAMRTMKLLLERAYEADFAQTNILIEQRGRKFERLSGITESFESFQKQDKAIERAKMSEKKKKLQATIAAILANQSQGEKKKALLAAIELQKKLKVDKETMEALEAKIKKKKDQGAEIAEDPDEDGESDEDGDFNPADFGMTQEEWDAMDAEIAAEDTEENLNYDPLTPSQEETMDTLLDAFFAVEGGNVTENPNTIHNQNLWYPSQAHAIEGGIFISPLVEDIHSISETLTRDDVFVLRNGDMLAPEASAADTIAGLDLETVNEGNPLTGEKPKAPFMKDRPRDFASVMRGAGMMTLGNGRIDLMVQPSSEQRDAMFTFAAATKDQLLRGYFTDMNGNVTEFVGDTIKQRFAVIKDMMKLADDYYGTLPGSAASHHSMMRVMRSPSNTEGTGTPDGKTPKPKPLPVVVGESGQEKINIKGIRARLKGMDPFDIQRLDNELKAIVRAGVIEKGLYKKWLKFNAKEDVAAVRKQMKDAPVKSDWWKRNETLIHTLSLIADPVTIEGWLLQISKADPESPIYQIFFQELVDPYTKSQQNNASTRRVLNDVAQDKLGMGTDTLKFVNYMNKRMPSGASKSEAMWAYALLTDAGREAAVRKDGVQARGVDYDVDVLVSELSDADKDFVRTTKLFFQNNPWIEKAFSNFLLLHGYESERSPSGWFTSRRTIEPTRLAENTEELAIDIVTSTSAMEARRDNVGSPFSLDGGYVAAYHQVADRLSNYAELGLPLYRIERLLNSTEFRKDFVNRYGQARFDNLVLYTKNILGFLGHNPTKFDIAMTYLPQAWLASKITLNPTSAIRQLFSLFTIMGDDVIDSTAMIRAMGEQAGFNFSVGRRMKLGSGFTYLRLNTGRFAEHLLVLGERKSTTKGAFWQDKAFVLQKLFDEWALRVSWRASEIMADKRKLKGDNRRAFIVRTFETALMRNQASNSPLYASEMELHAKRQPVWRGLLALQRELNRLYNVPRRHIMIAMHKPTARNIKQAGEALFYTAIANSVASVALRQLRNLGYGIPMDDLDELFRDYLQDLSGRWYLAGDAMAAFLEYGGKGQKYAAERLLGVGPGLFLSALNSTWSMIDAWKAGMVDLDDPETKLDRFVRSGPRRGQDKMWIELENSFDEGLSVFSGLVGMPFWQVYTQAKGYYRWKQKDYRLMVNLETERARLKDRGQTDGVRWREIEKLKGKINNIHGRREHNSLTGEEARSQIILLLEEDVFFGELD